MKLVILLLTAGLLQVQARALSQTVSLQGNHLTLEAVFTAIKTQTGYAAVYTKSMLEHAQPIQLDAVDMPLSDLLSLVFTNQPLSYRIEDQNIYVSYKNNPAPPAELKENLILAYAEVRGRVTDSLGKPLAGASVRVKGYKLSTSTDKQGFFTLANVPKDAILIISFMGYIQKEVNAQSDIGVVSLKAMSSELEQAEVLVNTGYQQLPKERATGSFAVVDNKLFNQQVSTDVLSRLEAVANGVVVDRSYSDKPTLMVRGLSTIQGPREVLIVVDNFPYEGDINNLNPNDIQDITILKDAAAASIWGARAGNGVIVIRTKKGQFNQPNSISLNTNVTISNKPNLYKIPQVSSDAFVEYEKFLYERGYYDSNINATPSTFILSPVVELLIKKDHATSDEDKAKIDAQIDQYKTIDIRDDMMRYLYRQKVDQQYALSMTGGTDQLAWAATANYDHNVDELHAKYNRLNLSYKNVFKPVKNVELTSGIYYTQSMTKSGAEGYGLIKQIYNGFYPYTRIADDSGNPIGITKDYREAWTDTLYPGKLLDWKYYPLTDYKDNYTIDKIQDMVFKGGINYRFLPVLALDVKYQYERQTQASNNLWGVNSYTMRSTINMYSQIQEDGSVQYGYPYGGRYTYDNSTMESHQLRAQLNLEKHWGNHQIVAIAGSEVRTLTDKSNGGGVYGYDEDLLTYTTVNYEEQIPSITGSGYTTLSDLTSTISDKTTRFVSFFGNAAYTYLSKYTLSLSTRTDASNLFGLKINDQWNPFYSAGLSWNISDENFYRVSWLPKLKLRSTYGISGNIDPAMTAVTTIAYSYSNNTYNNARQANFNHYYNPELRWETSRQFNLGADFSTANNRINGSLEYFYKHGIHLFGNALLDYTAGAGISITKNVASMKGRGLDLELNAIILNHQFGWQSKLNFSIYHDKLTDYYLSSKAGGDYISIPAARQGRPSKVGYPVNSVFSYKWAGLEHETGDPLGYLNGEISKDYAAMYSATTLDDLVFSGSSIPTRYGSWINSFSYKGLELNMAISFKLNYFFRRETVDFEQIARQAIGHNDFEKRWKNPGDEKFTNIPSLEYPFDNYRSDFYRGSEAFVEKGDHARLQYIQLSYTLTKKQFPKLPFSDIRIYGNANNLGIIWRANKLGIDPDAIYGYENYGLPAVSSYSLGLNITFNK